MRRGSSPAGAGAPLLASTQRKDNAPPPVLSALLFDLRHAHVTDFVRVTDMCAAAGLQVVSDDLDEPYAAGPDRGLDRHGLDQVGRGFEFRIGDPAGAHA